MFKHPVVLLGNAKYPTAVLLSAVVFAVKAQEPIAVFLIPPASTESKAVSPKATLSVL